MPAGLLITLSREVQGLEILGAPVGSDEFVAAAASSKIIKAVEFGGRVAAVAADPRQQWCSLRCATVLAGSNI